MITVELDIFSARPNPVWTLTDKEAKELIDRVLANPSLTDPPKSSGNLGYRGFIITASDEAKTTLEKAGLPSFFYVESSKRAASELALVTSIETGKAVPKEGKKFALDSIKADRKLREDFWKKHRSKDSLKADTPKGKGYEPSLDPVPRALTNCRRRRRQDPLADHLLMNARLIYLLPAERIFTRVTRIFLTGTIHIVLLITIATILRQITEVILSPSPGANPASLIVLWRVIMPQVP
jgi:hypothetical protein